MLTLKVQGKIENIFNNRRNIDRMIIFNIEILKNGRIELRKWGYVEIFLEEIN